MWECRFILAELPARLAHDTLSRTLGQRYSVVGRELDETDDYLLTRTPALNLKLRHRSNTLKLKSLRGVSADRLEQWQTDFERELPAAPDVWSEALRMLDAKLEPGRVSSAETAERAVTVLRPLLRQGQVVRVKKVRWLYGDGRRRIEVAFFALGPARDSARFATVCVESDDADDVREVLSALSLAELGAPRNYMEVLHGL